MRKGVGYPSGDQIGPSTTVGERNPYAVKRVAPTTQTQELGALIRRGYVRGLSTRDVEGEPRPGPGGRGAAEPAGVDGTTTRGHGRSPRSGLGGRRQTAGLRCSQQSASQGGIYLDTEETAGSRITHFRLRSAGPVALLQRDHAIRRPQELKSPLQKFKHLAPKRSPVPFYLFTEGSRDAQRSPVRALISRRLPEASGAMRVTDSTSTVTSCPAYRFKSARSMAAISGVKRDVGTIRRVMVLAAV
jgi:hypothetical protein